MPNPMHSVSGADAIYKAASTMLGKSEAQLRAMAEQVFASMLYHAGNVMPAAIWTFIQFQPTGLHLEVNCPRRPTKIGPDQLPEEDRQAILLAIAKLSIERPGWLQYLGEIADRFTGRELFNEFRKIHRESP